MIPLEAFFRRPAAGAVALAPSGGSIAFLKSHRSRMRLWIRDLSAAKDAGRLVSGSDDRDVSDFRWVTDDRLVYMHHDVGSAQNSLCAVNRDGTNRRLLSHFAGPSSLLSVGTGRLEESSDTGEPFVLVQTDLRRSHVSDLCRVGAESGTITIAARNPGFVRQWFTDSAGKVTLVVGTRGPRAFLLWRPPKTDQWQQVEEYGFGEIARPLFFGKESRTVFVSSNAGRDKACLCRLDLETGREEVVFEHPEVDVEQASYSRRRELLEFAMYETDRACYRFFDDEVKERFVRIQKSLQDSEVKNPELRLCSRSDDESQWVVHAGRPNWRGAYYHVDHGTGALREIGKVSPWLPDVLDSVTEPIRVRGRDGLSIPGYLTLPDTEKRHSLPMVVVPHGGPWSRDSSGFNPEVEFLASRGYAVLRLNYRGSRGYGRRFLEAGYRQWGLAIQDDITDGVLWALQEGVADPSRVAIFGCSFGGYIALCGLAKTPEIFSCGVSYAGISNLLTWLGKEPERWGPYGALVPRMIGDPVRDETRLRAGSPSYLADRIKAPVFIAHGGLDRRTSMDEAMKFVEMLRTKGRRVTYLFIDGEGHGFQREENRIHFYSQLEEFLGEHLGKGDASPDSRE